MMCWWQRRHSDEQASERPRQRWGRVGALVLLACVCLSLVFLSSLRPHTTVAAHPLLYVSRSNVVDTRQPSTGCGKAPPFAAGTTSPGTLTSSGLPRQYWLHIPQGYQQAHPYPLVLVFHGHSGTALHMERGTGFSQLADSAGFLVAYPQGVIGPDRLTGWSSGGPHKPQVADVLFVSNLLNHLQSEVCVDPNRIYATGFSNGGGMTSVLACTLAGRIAAFAPVSGSYFALAGGCNPGRPVSILEFHGTADRIVPYNGRPPIGEQGAWQWSLAWAARDGCLTPPLQFYAKDDVAGFVWPGCQGHATVIHYRLVGGIHVWPHTLASHAGSKAPHVDSTLNATQLIWQFFAAHPLPTLTTKL